MRPGEDPLCVRLRLSGVVGGVPEFVDASVSGPFHEDETVRRRDVDRMGGDRLSRVDPEVVGPVACPLDAPVAGVILREGKLRPSEGLGLW